MAISLSTRKGAVGITESSIRSYRASGGDNAVRKRIALFKSLSPRPSDDAFALASKKVTRATTSQQSLLKTRRENERFLGRLVFAKPTYAGAN
jgi:hypothetical protein